MYDPKPPGPVSLQDAWQPAGKNLVEADSQRSRVRLLAEAYRELLSFHLADVDADTNLILRSIQRNVDMEESPNAAAARSSRDSQRTPSSNCQMK